MHLFSPAATETIAFSIVNLLVLVAVFAVATVTAVYTSSRLSRAIICTAIVILIPPISYYYVLIFMMIPFMEYLMSFDSLSRPIRILYGCAFMFMMLTPILLPQIYIPHMLIISSMLAYEEYKVIKNEILPRLGRKRTAA